MSKAINTVTLRSKSARRSIPVGPKLHIVKLIKGLALGYRKGAKGGSWFARRHEDGTKYSFHPLGIADDTSDADGLRILTFDQAQESARTWFSRRANEETGGMVAGPYTVEQAMEDYIVERERVKRKSLYRTRKLIAAHILPTLGSIELSKLTQGRVKAWRDTVAQQAPRLRTGFVMERVQVSKLIRGERKLAWVKRATDVPLPQTFRDVDTSDPDVVRMRQATANRILSVLKAGLNYAHEETKRVGTKAAWEGVKPFRQVDVAKVRFMTHDEIKALISHCAPEFGSLVRGALLTGCRYGELAAMRVSAFDAQNETIFIPVSKNGSSRHVELNAEGAAFFAALATGRSKGEQMFVRANGKRWCESEQARPMKEACAAAKIEQVTFHILRHTYASHLAMNQTPMRVIADQLGHKDTRITERHYAHLGRAYVRETIRTKLPSFGFAAA